MMTQFLKNAWYVAAWSDELADDLSSRSIINESVLFYRDSNGQMHAMDNTCPHRYSPLDRGKLINDCVQCHYHALTFNSEGKCIHNPNGNQIIPGKSDLKVYPVKEIHDMIWIWMGDPELADKAKIQDFSCHTDPEFPTVKGVIEIDAYYELITDNLMDLTHVVTVHADILGSEAVARGENTVLQEGTTVWSNSWCPDGLAPPAWDAMFNNYGKPVDHWLNMRWDAPCNMLLDVGITPAGTSRNKGIWIYGTDILTPISDDKTRYFWAVSRSHDIDDPKYGEIWTGAIQAAFVGQDKPMLESQQRMLKQRGGLDIDDFSHAAIGTDAGPVRARYVLRKLLKGEANGELLEPKNSDLKSLREKCQQSDEVGVAV